MSGRRSRRSAGIWLGVWLSACSAQPDGVGESPADDVGSDSGLGFGADGLEIALMSTPATPPSDAIRGLIGKCIEATGGGTADGTRIKTYQCNQSAAQKWKLMNGTIRGLGKCLDRTNGGTAVGTDIQLWNCGGNNQDMAYNNGALMSAGKCLAVTGGANANGARIELATCSGATAQQWRYVDGSFRSGINPNRCIDIAGGSNTNGTAVQLYDCNGSAAQRFTMTNMELRPAHASTKCLDIINNNQVNDTRVQLWTCNGSAAQDWTWDGNDIKATGGLCLDIHNASTASNTDVKLWSCNGNAPQQNFYVANRVQTVPPLSGRPSGFAANCQMGGSCVRSTNNGSHSGSDWAAPAGTAVFAICDGTVDQIVGGSADVWNEVTIVRCQNVSGYPSLFAYYGHMNRSVARGQAVSRGQQIGTIGNLGGNSHLHFSLNTTTAVTNGWGYIDLGVSTPAGCGGNTTRRDLMRDRGWLDADSFADSLGWWSSSSTTARGCP